MTDFDRANSVGSAYVTDWVPGGSTRGDEYIAKNPTRYDAKPGSFSINLKSGKWADFAQYDAKGNDFVSLYAYVYRSQLKGNTESQIQVEAMKEILRRYNGEDFTEYKSYKKPETGYWAGFRCLPSGIDNPPKIDYAWHEKSHGKFERDWDFYGKSGKLIFKVARFRDSEGKKADRPFTLWQKDEVIKWRAKKIEGKTPLYNLLNLMKKEELPVLLTEGQKNAEDSRPVLEKHFVTTSTYGKLDYNDLEPLRGREVYIWVDPDGTGRKKASALKSSLMSIDCRVHLVHSPSGKKKWDISDAILEGWTTSQLVQHIESFPVEGQTVEKTIYADDLSFKIVGISEDYIYIYSPRFRMVKKFKANSINKGSLMNLMSISDWNSVFPTEKGPNWDMAIDFILEEAEKAPLFDSSLVRGAGLWRDTGGKFVCSTGEGIIVDGQLKDLMGVDSKYVYKRAKYRPYTAENPMDSEESNRIYEVLNKIDFDMDLYRVFLGGWLALAPFGGCLKWRPNVWLTGPSGSGKTWVHGQIVSKMLDGFAEKVAAAGSTEPGIRQRLNNCASPVVIDEMESNDKKSKETVSLLLDMARQSSSGTSDVEILKGSADQQGVSFKINSMFFFASILASVKHGSDMDRIEILELADPNLTAFEDRTTKFEELQESVAEVLTPDFSTRFYARILNNFEEVLKAVDVFVKISSKVLQTQRGGDQKGTLLAGCYMISHDTAPTKEEAVEWVSQFDIKSARENNSIKQDHEICLDHILSYQVDIPGRRKVAIGVLIDEYLDPDYQTDGIPDQDIPKYLVSFGIKIKSEGVRAHIGVAINYPKIQEILKETPWENTYGKLLRRHSDYVKDNPELTIKQRFAGSLKSTVWLKFNEECPF